MSYISLHKIAVFLIIVISLVFIFYVKNSYIQRKVSRLNKCTESIDSATLLSKNSNEKMVVMIGDSRISDWGVPDFGKNIETYNLGIAGATSREIICALDGEINKEHIQLFIVQMGINDLVASGFLKDEQRQQVKQSLISNIKSLSQNLADSNTHVLVLSIVPPIKIDIVRQFLWGENITEDVEELNSALQNDLIEENIHFFDMKNIMYDFGQKSWKQELARDALHWQPTVYDSLNVLVKDALKDIDTYFFKN